MFVLFIFINDKNLILPFFRFAFSKIIPINFLSLSCLNFICDFLFHLDGFQLLIEDFKNLLSFLQIFDTAMSEWAFKFETSQTKFTGTRFFRRLEVIDKFHMFRKLIKNLKKKLSLIKRMMMLKIAIRINTNRIISAVVNRHFAL